MGVGLPVIIGQYNQQQARTPKPLADSTGSHFSPAADAVPAQAQAQAAPISSDLAAQLGAEYALQKNGKSDPRHIKTLDEGRTAYSKTYLNADGSKSLSQSFLPSSYQDSAGSWHDVDSTLDQDAATGKWHSRANAWQVHFGSISASGGVDLVKGSQTVSFAPVGIATVDPVITGTAPNQKVTYRNAWQGIDLVYTVDGAGLKEQIVVKSKAAPTSFSFDIAGTHLTPDTDPAHKGWLKLDGNLSDFEVPAPTVATPAQGVVGADPTVTQSLSGNRLTVTLDQNWLQNLGFADFPVSIDPTYQSFQSFSVTNNWYVNYKSDGFVCNPGQGCGNSTGSVSNKYWRFMYHVAFSQLAGNYLINATIHTEMPDCSGTWGTCSGHYIAVSRGNCMGFNCIDGRAGYSNYNQWNGQGYTFDVTGLYRNLMNDNDYTNWQIVIGEEAQNNYYSYKLFNQNATNVVFTYDRLPPVSNQVSPANGGTVTSNQPVLTTTPVTDQDADQVSYRFTVYTNSNGTGALANSGWNAATQWSVPDNVLQDGTTYYWKVETWDNVAGAPSTPSAITSFKVDLRNGKDATQSQDTVGPVSVDMANGNVTTSAKSHSIAALGGNLGVSLDYNSPQQSRQGLVGQYWNDPNGTLTFPSTPAQLTKVDPNIGFYWASSTPAAGIISSDHFLTRWTGYFVAPVAGTYTFKTEVDDRCRLWVNNSLTVDSWTAYCGWHDATPITLSAGQVIPIKMEFAEIGGTATAELWVRATNAGQTVVADQVIPPTWLQTGVRPVATPHGLVGRYYTDDGSHNFPIQDDPTRIFLTRTDSSLTQDWGSGAPVPGGPTTNFLTRWTGYYTPPVSGAYNFQATASDGVKVTIGTTPTTVINAWSDHEPAATVGPTAPITLTAGTPVPITVDYYQKTGTDSISLLVNRPDYGTGVYVPVDSSTLSPNAQVLPDGWNLGVDADGNVGYDYVVINANSVVLHDSTGDTHEYKFAGGGFTPPVNEDGHMVRNGDGTITLQDSDGRTYVFDSNGTLKQSSQPVDDRSPAALQYTYGGSPSHLTQITDAVNTSRWAKVHYWGDSGFSCPTTTGYNTSPQSGFICQVETSDGQTTNFYYTTDNRLGRIQYPGNEFTDYGYLPNDGSNSCPGCLSSLRDSLANDAIASGQRLSTDTTIQTDLTYDALGRASTATMPAANVADTRQAHNYEYQIGYTNMHVANATEPNGFSRKVAYDATFRTTADTDVANLTSTTQWDAVKDQVLATTDPTGLKSTTIYDYADRPTDQYGPAPSAWFGTDRKPLTTPTDYTGQVPHTQTGYDESINGLATSYYNVSTAANGTGTSTKLLYGAPKLHATGIGPSNGDVVQTWNGTPPFTPDSGYGWGARLSGDVYLSATGNYTFTPKSDDGARLWIDDQLISDDWTDGAYRTHASVAFNNATANTWHRVRLDYYNKSGDTDAHLELWMTPPGGSSTSSLGSLLKPHYGLTTSQTTYDSSSSVGTVTSTTNYGTNPELGLAQSSNLDSAGLNYTSSSTYEAPGSGSFLRQTAKYLPGANPSDSSTGTQYAYYAATDTADNPCTSGTTEAYKQAGLLKLKTEADPDGAGSLTGRTTETIYDDAGRVVATRYNSDPWTCTSYDARGRVTEVDVPSFNGQPARTITNNWSVGGNPYVVSSSDSSGTITTTSDLLGRTTSYTDALGNTTNYTYDTLGRLSGRTGPLGTEAFTYDNYNRLTAQQLDGTTQATPSYDAFGRLSSVAYPTAGSLALAISRDTLGRTVGTSYTLGGGTAGPSDSVSRSQSGQIVSGTELGNAKSYTYDKAGRLTAATIGANTYGYSFAAPTTCTGTYNANSGKNSNRTSQTVNGVTSTYCYDNADRFVSSSDAKVDSAQYDAHGNTTQLGTTPVTQFTYDSSDRNSSITEGSKSVSYTRDVQNRVITRNLVNGSTTTNKYAFTGSGDTPDLLLDGSNNVVEKYEQLPGGVLLTIRPNNTSPANRVFSLVNVHGDAIATTDAAGAQTGTFTYDPFGNSVATNPDNTASGSTYGWVGQHEKDTESAFTLAPTEMGARVYLASIGRFLQVDPIEGGTPNNYVYPPDPVNDSDLDGNFSVLSWARNHSDLVMAGIGIGACAFLTGGACLAVAAATAVAGGIASGANEYGASAGNMKSAVAKGAISGAFDMLGAAKFRVGRLVSKGAAATAVRYFGPGRNYGSVATALSKRAGRTRAVKLLKGAVKSYVRGKAIDYLWNRWRGR